MDFQKFTFFLMIILAYPWLIQAYPDIPPLFHDRLDCTILYYIVLYYFIVHYIILY